MKILVIGATGSTGLYLVDYLAKNNYDVTATGLKTRDVRIYNENGVKYISLDVSNKDQFLKLPTNFDCVVLLAGMVPSRMAGYDPYQYFYTNTIGALNTLEFCRINNIPKIIYAQSHSDVAGHWNTGKFIKENALRSLNLKGDHAVYIISKCAALDLMEHYHQQYGLQTISFRMPTIYCYWPDDTFYVNGTKTKMAYLKMINQAMKGETIEIWGDPTIAKDMIYIKDFVQLIELAIKNNNAHGIFNAGTGIPTTLEEQIRGIIKVFCKPNNQSKVIYRPDKPSQQSYLYDVSKAEKELGYIVRFPYLKSLEDMKNEMNNPWFIILK